MKKQFYLILTLLLGIGILLSGCGASQSTGDSVAQPPTLEESSESTNADTSNEEVEEEIEDEVEDTFVSEDDDVDLGELI